MIGTSWTLEYVDGSSVTRRDRNDATLTFDGDHVTGSDGCNRYSARWELSGQVLEIRYRPQTLIGCEDTRDRVADRMWSVLIASPTVGFSGDELRLVAADGVLDFRRIEAVDDGAGPWPCLGWLRDALMVAGSPTGDGAHDWRVHEGYLRAELPDSSQVWVFAEEPDLVNVSVDTLPVAGTAGIFTLHASKVMDVWQLLAESDEVWVVAHIDPPELAPTDGRALRWIRALADFAMEVPPPPCDS